MTNPTAARLDGKLETLDTMRERSQQGGGTERIERQHKGGKLTARERIDLLVDPGSFREVDAFVVQRARDFGMDKPENQFIGDSVIQAGEPSTGGWCTCFRKISRSLAARFLKSTPRKSSRSWRWR